jgi:hypothetical protein
VTRASRSLLTIASAAAVWLAVACLDVSSPITGIASISRIVAPTPSVVVGDSLRDTSGTAQPLRVYVFGPKGDTVKDAVVRFFAVDTLHKIHVDSMTGVVWADDSVSPNAAVFASVQPASGKGSLVTPLDTIPVIPVPVSATRDTSFLFTATAPTIPTDTLSSGLISPPFGVVVQGAGNTPIQKYVVGFQLLYAPPARADGVGPTVVPTSALSNTDSTYAITDASGRATIRLRLRVSAINSNLLLGTATDSAVVQMHVRYHGTDLPVTPSGPIVIRLQVK